MGDNLYWVGGSDQNCEGKFGWCEIDRPFAPWIPWDKHEPNNGPSSTPENCAYLYYLISFLDSAFKAKFGDDDCEGKFYFICEVRLLSFIMT
jgi:hypothetical protein